MINDKVSIAKHCIKLKFRAVNNNFEKELDFLVIPSISDRVPNRPFPRHLIDIPKNLRLADPQFHLPRPVDLLIGSGATLSLLSIGQIDLSENDCDLILQKTKLGWIIAGGLNEHETYIALNYNLIELTSLMERFWRVEELDTNSKKSLNDELSEIHYRNNFKRNFQGRYIVRLPFKQNNINFGNSKSQALRRFYSLQRKLELNSTLKTEYCRVMQEYLDLGHMSLVNDEQEDGYYIPHHAVIKDSSSTTKVRVVFDASAKSSNNISLNDTLLVGPTIQRSLFEHLISFRTYKFVLTADIEKMYRQVLIDPRDRKFQRILWFHGQQIKTYELNTVTFGVSAAPFLAIRTIHQLADDERDKYPRASAILKRDFYVDDLLTGADTLEEILQIRDEIIQILLSGGFVIQKWASNHQHALDNLHEKIFNLDHSVEKKSILKPLGVVWNAQNDSLTYTTNPIDNLTPVTKRKILSEIAKIFDPLGLLGPIILFIKLLMQDCWKAKLGWDESVPQNLFTRWNQFSQQLNLINDFTIDRRILIDNFVEIQIHGFCDASQLGYGACFYIRSVDSWGHVCVRLLCAKSRVAPVKNLTIPKLELSAAHLLVKLYNEISPSLNFKFQKIICWSDSTIALSWIEKSPLNLKIFESNRVKFIQSSGDKLVWKHVRSENNPADALSRGQLPSEFLNNKSWFCGPEWLSLPEQDWPISLEIHTTTLPEATVCVNTGIDNVDLFSRSSSYKSLVKVIAKIIRFFRLKKGFKDPITVEEKLHAETKILLLTQKDAFAKEIKRLSTCATISKGEPSVPFRKTTKFDNLNPFLDEQGLIRVGGRLKKSDLTFNNKHPILLPNKHHVTDLIIKNAHEQTYHGGVQTTLHVIRQNFWIFNGRDSVRRIIKKCIACFRQRPGLLHAQMANLPKYRVTVSPPFYHTGLDFFGPIFIKEKKLRNRNRIKAYGCIFVCMATKALNIEIVSDLTTAGFLGALRRFISRVGIPSHIYSDNGTNFVGANNELIEIYAMLNDERHKEAVNSFALNKNITWHFNPPLSPHFGGLWEAAVKSFKYHFKRVLKNQLLTFEELNTFAKEIEAVLNSRPLCVQSSDPNDPTALTPADILIGRPFTSLPDNRTDLIPVSRLSSWNFINHARNEFWKRWHGEYLDELQGRNKWHGSNVQIKVGSVVVIRDSNTPCSQWPLGVVIETYPGDDGVIRVVSIKTAAGVYKRNITRLCLLPFQESIQNK